MNKEFEGLRSPTRNFRLPVRFEKSLTDMLLEAEDERTPTKEFRLKSQALDFFQENEPDFYDLFATGVVTPYELIVKTQNSFENQRSLVELRDGTKFFASALVTPLQRYVPNLQYLHDRLHRTDADSFASAGLSLLGGVVTSGIIELIGRELYDERLLSFETAGVIALSVALGGTIWSTAKNNREVFYKSPWDSAIYLGANMYDLRSDSVEQCRWDAIPRRLFKTRPFYNKLNEQYSLQSL